jgi:hypothetical protein
MFGIRMSEMTASTVSRSRMCRADAISGFERCVALGFKSHTQEFPVGGNVVNDEEIHGFNVLLLGNRLSVSAIRGC